MPSKASPSKNIDGILLVNKPYGLTSNAVLQQVKHLFKAKKAGHTGSLDPMATGMLPICFGEATKFSQYLLDADKCYEVTGLLGVKTNTADAMGEVISRDLDFVPVAEDHLHHVLSLFAGDIYQVPSMFSALKHQGMPLYKYARAGIEVKREARPVKIKQLQLNQFDGRQLSLTVTCSKGTYIRNLIEDIGEQLNTGAHVTRLHRLYCAGFADEKMYSIEALRFMPLELLSSCLLPIDRAINYLPKLSISNDEAFAMCQGRTVELESAPEISGCVRLYQNGTQFIGLGEINAPAVLKVKRLLATSSF